MADRRGGRTPGKTGGAPEGLARRLTPAAAKELRAAHEARLQAAWSAAHAALDRAETVDGPLPEILMERAELLEEEGRPDEAITAAEAGLRAEPGPASRSKLLNIIGHTLLRVGRLDEANGHFLEAERLAGAVGSDTENLRARVGQARVLHFRGHRGEARRLLADAERRLQRIRDPTDLATTLNLLAMVQMNDGDYARAIATAERALRHAEEAGWLYMQAGMHSNLGHLYRSRGLAQRSRRSLERSLEISKSAGLPIRRLLALSNLAALEMEAGRIDAAQEAVRQGLEEIPRARLTYGELWIYRRAAEVALALKDPGKTADWALRMEGIAEAGGFATLRAVSLALQGAAAAQQGGGSAAREMFERAVLMIVAARDPEEEGEIRRLYGEALDSLGAPSEGRVQLETARDLFRSRGLLTRVTRVEQVLARHAPETGRGGRGTPPRPTGRERNT